ncbi:MAG: hypothetical protein LBT89_12505 [Planctomycetaceae bacterium]|jgi:hypothetical protein|nr:hypothetical protein [Planctomycetaceae bacterium]
MDKIAVFSEQYGRRIKSAVDAYVPPEPSAAATNSADVLSGYSSPVEIVSSWTQEGQLWKCGAVRLWHIDGEYKARDDGKTIDLYAPCSGGVPDTSIGSRVFAFWRGVWELVSGGASAPSGKIYGIIKKAVQCPIYVTGDDSLPAPALGSEAAKLPDKKTDKPVQADYKNDAGEPDTDAYKKACNQWYAWRCIGRVAVEGKEYAPLPKTYEGGEPYFVDPYGNEKTSAVSAPPDIPEFQSQRRRKKTDKKIKVLTDVDEEYADYQELKNTADTAATQADTARQQAFSNPDDTALQQAATAAIYAALTAASALKAAAVFENEKQHNVKTDDENNAVYDSDYLLVYKENEGGDEDDDEDALKYDEVMCFQLAWDEVLPSGLRLELTAGSYEYEQFKTDAYGDILYKNYIGTVLTADLLPQTAPSNLQGLYRVGDENTGSYVWYKWDAENSNWVAAGTATLEKDKISVTKNCYRAIPPESYITTLNGQGDYEDFTPEWLPETFNRRRHKLKEVEDSSPTEYAEPELLSLDGACRKSDDTYSSMTVEDDAGTKFTFLVGLDLIPVLAYAQARYVTCYFANEASDCNPEYATPNYQVDRSRIKNEERLELTGGDCLKTCSCND